MTDRQLDLIRKINHWRAIEERFPNEPSAKVVLKSLHIELRKTMRLVHSPRLTQLASRSLWPPWLKF